MKSVPNYEPGTVAVATVPNYAEPLIDGCDTYEARVSRYSDGWALLSDPDIFWPDHRGQVSNVRPLLVLDIGTAPENIGTWEQIHMRLRQSHLSKTAQWLADQIEAQTKPPRIPEPGLWGVVEARGKCSPPSRRWVRYGTGWRDAFGSHVEWDDLIDPVLVREGVEA